MRVTRLKQKFENDALKAKSALTRKEANKKCAEISGLIQNHQIRSNSTEQPIEYKNLYQYARRMPQGSLEMILDILTPSESNVSRPINIKPPEPQFYEIR